MNELHGHEDQAVRFLHRVEVDDIRMIEGGRRFGFALKQRETIGGRGNVTSRKLERDAPIESGILGDVDIPHSAATELRQDDVVAELLTDHNLRARLVIRSLSEAKRREGALAAFAASSVRIPAVPDACPALGAGPRIVEHRDALQRGSHLVRRRGGCGWHERQRSVSAPTSASRFFRSGSSDSN